MKKIGIYGAGGHGKVVADIAKANDYEVVFIDDSKEGFLNYQEYKKRYNYPIAWGIGENLTRYELSRVVHETLTLIHPKAIVSPSAKVEQGVVVMPGAIINADAIIEEGAIINSGAVVEHECIIGKFCHIAPNVSLAGGVRIGELSFIGIGSNIVQNIDIGARCIIGAGSLVLENIPNEVVAYGVPAKIKRRSL